MAIELIAGPDDEDRRIDRVLRKALPDHPLSLIHRLLRQGKVQVNNNKVTPEYRIAQGAIIRIETQLLNDTIKQVNKNTYRSTVIPNGMPEILWEGCGIVVFNKPAGLASHGLKSLDSIVKAQYAASQPDSLSFKPGPLHRLDKPTSGIIVFSQNINGARLFSRLMQEHNITKTYLAILEGKMTCPQTWEDMLYRDSINRKTKIVNNTNTANAITTANPLAVNKHYTLAKIQIFTGKTHQIRVQAASRGHPLAGDKKYGGRPALSGFFLHAWQMDFHNEKNIIPVEFPRSLTAPIPENFLKTIEEFFGENIAKKLL